MQTIRRFQRSLVRVTDASSPSGASIIAVQIMERKGDTVRVEGLYNETVALSPAGFIPAGTGRGGDSGGGSR